MNKLFKNSFKSFLGSKLAMILLSLAVFLSIAVFTMLSSTSWAFDSSYNQVVNVGQLHDFTVNEKYTIDGTDGFKTTHAVKTIHGFKDPSHKEAYTKDTKFTQLFKVERKRAGSTTFNTINRDMKLLMQNSQIIVDPKTRAIIAIKGGFDLKISKADSNPTIPFDTLSPSVTIDENIKQPQIFKTLNGDEYKITMLQGWKDIEQIVINEILPTVMESTDKTIVSLKMDWTKVTGSYKQSLMQGPTQADNDKLVNEIFISHGVNEVIIDSKNPTQAEIDSNNNVKKMISNGETAINEYVTNTKSKLFVKATQDKYGKYLAKDGIKSVESIYINSGKNQYKVVNTLNNEKEVDKLVMFKGNAPQKAMSITDMQKFFIEKIKQDKALNELYKQFPEKIQNGKGYKIVFDNGFGTTASFTDLTAYQAVITDGFAKQHNIKPIPEYRLLEFNELILQAGLNINEINKIFNLPQFKEYVHKIDQTPYIITGIGTTPDFSFPIINQQNPLPNTKTQALIFTNDHGYKRIEDAFRGNQRENYLAYKFARGVSEADKNRVMNGITQLSKQHMSWGNNLNPVSGAFDINEKIILAPQRIAFLKKLKDSVTTIAFLTTALLGILTGFIILMVIKKQISSKRKILGTLLANGYSKNEIAWSMTTIALIIVLIPATLGYVVGHFMQTVFINMFTNYWTLPIYNHSFSWVTLILVVALPMLAVILFSYVASRLALKGSLISILSDSQSKTAGWITSQVLKPLAWIGIKSKITISLFTSNLSKMFLVLITTTVAMVAGGVAFSIMGRFNYAQETSNNKVNYTFKVDMASPTLEGGLMKRINPEQLGTQGANWLDYSTNDYKKIFVEEVTDSKGNNPAKEKRLSHPGSYFHIPTNDDLNEKDKVDYLNNRLQFKSLLNFEISQGLNPWKAALSSMPENQRNIADLKEKEFVKALSLWAKETNTPQIMNVTPAEWEKIAGLKGFLTVAVHNEYEFDSKALYADKPTWELYKKFLFYGLKEQVKRYHRKKEYHLPYFISYNNITTDNGDEVYTHIDVAYKATNLSGHNEIVNTTITGINPKTKMVKFDEGLLDRFKEFHYDVTRDNEQVIPVIINTYFEKAYGIEKGEVIDIDIKNRADRFHSNSPSKARAMVIGIQESYDGPKIYTTQSIANAKLGWVNPIQNKQAFNGVYTTAENPMIFQNISLYSPSGIYPGTDIISTSNQKLDKAIETYVQDNYSNPRVTNLSTYLNIYSNSPYISTFSSANWAAMSRYAFQNILDLSGKLIWMVEGIAIFIAILFVAIIASMIISDNKKFISTMKVLGYRNKEIRRMFFRSLIPAIIMGLLMAIPITIGALFAIKAIIISFGAILVPISMMGWELILTFFLITFAFAIIYYVSMRKLGNEETLEAFKA
ncbi:MAG: FtsX-like permease family protein [Mycoplasmatales bacterium]|nr:FtsX-like permease family protein [Mycoplasmatales bacterium]